MLERDPAHPNGISLPELLAVLEQLFVPRQTGLGMESYAFKPIHEHNQLLPVHIKPLYTVTLGLPGSPTPMWCRSGMLLIHIGLPITNATSSYVTPCLQADCAIRGLNGKWCSLCR